MEEKNKKKMLAYLIMAIILVLMIFVVIVMAANSRKPAPIALAALESNIKGAAFGRVNEILIEQMKKNWLPNDIFWPTALLDNMPNYQLGELEVVRYNVRVLRDNLSRMRTTDKLDPAVEGAFTSLSNDPFKWWFPSAESKWEKAHRDLRTYYNDLSTGKSHFYPRADNLVQLLQQYVSLMGGVNTRLINAPRDIYKAVAVEGEVKETPENAVMVDVDIPWIKIDNNFYYAQGVAYALNESFKAIRIDFIDVLTDKNSVVLIDKILEYLDRCQFEPLVVFNGNPESIFANHSLNLSGIFNDARQKMSSLIVALQQG